MKSKIIIFVFASIFLLMMIPSIQAVEHQTVRQSFMEKISAEHPEIIQTIKDKLESNEINQDIFKIIFMIIYAVFCGIIGITFILSFICSLAYYFIKMYQANSIN